MTRPTRPQGRKGSFDSLGDAVAARYREAGRSHQGFVRGKLRFDPVYRALLFGDWLPASGRLVDIGCGRGMLLALIDTARRECATWAAPGDWTPPSQALTLHGIEQMAGAAAAARTALGTSATIEVGDVTAMPLPRADAILLLDVLHYLEGDEQIKLIARAAQALTADGVLVMREADARPGWRFAVTRAAERLRALFRGDGRQRFCYRSAAAWQGLLEEQGLAVCTQSMSDGTPFDNQLIVAYRETSGR